jgi:hypothetical protein
MGRDVFLSYSSEDKTQADAVCAALEARGFSVWIAPRDIPPGANRAGSTAEAIGGAKALVLILSSAANGSAQVLREVQQAISREATVVPFQIEAIQPNPALAYRIGAAQPLDARGPPQESHYEALADVVRRIARPDPAPHPPPPDLPRR